MIKKGRKLIFAGIVLFLFIAVCAALFVINNNVSAGTSEGLTATVRITVCGNGVVEPPDEECDFDGPALNGKTCQTQGYGGGNLGCLGTCEFDTSACTAATPTPTPVSSPTPTPTTPSGGGGGGGGVYLPQTAVSFSGRAYPLSQVTILKDGQRAITTIAGPDAKFDVTLAGLASGNYNFALYGEDSGGGRSNLFVFSVYITQGATTRVSGIFVAPTIGTDKSEVKKGDNIVIFGQSAPNSEIIISISSDEEFFEKMKSDEAGAYLYNFDTSLLDWGEHFTKAKASLGYDISPYSKAIGFIIGSKNIIRPRIEFIKGDLNGDKRVNLIDFSIFAYWYKRVGPPANADLNGDAKVDLADFSIMAYFWTG